MAKFITIASLNPEIGYAQFEEALKGLDLHRLISSGLIGFTALVPPGEQIEVTRTIMVTTSGQPGNEYVEYASAALAMQFLSMDIKLFNEPHTFESIELGLRRSLDDKTKISEILRLPNRSV